jgi:putative spermidine/putrescine transport system ATP-binding protein
LYEEPRTRFAATFVGARNVIELPVRDGRITFGRAFDVAAPMDANGRALAFFRPEDVMVFDDGAQGEPATIELKVFLGPTTRLHLRSTMGVEGVTYQADVASRAAERFTLGDRVLVRIEPEHVRSFPAPAPGST